jgi:hypothetical protein
MLLRSLCATTACTATDENSPIGGAIAEGGAATVGRPYKTIFKSNPPTGPSQLQQGTRKGLRLNWLSSRFDSP